MNNPEMNRDTPQVPHGFRTLVKRQMETVNLSLRTVALILKLAEVLRVDPPERLLVEAKRVPDLLLPALLSAHEAVSRADLKEAMKQLQAVILNQRKKRGRR